ncbi:AAA family ATPase [Microbacterium lacticum]|uniref:AAA family ATPase n=1 Tax=Microbacterium lacticum TaxID=33885 RepID=UPI0028D3F942|nr:AAA family ATPase [Microbacterium lacticum]
MASEQDAHEDETTESQGDETRLPPLWDTPRILGIELTNFLSYKRAHLELSDFTAIVGPNASGKSNAVKAFRLLRDIPTYGLPVALARHGGFDQLRHRSNGKPNDPAIKLHFAFDDAPPSFYEISLGSVSGKKYRVKSERALVNYGTRGDFVSFHSDGSRLSASERLNGPDDEIRSVVAPGQSALSTGSFASYVVQNTLRSIQTIEINPALVGALQDPSSTDEFDPAGSNTTSVFEALTQEERAQVTERLSAVVPGIVRIEPQNFADKQTLAFFQHTASGNRKFLAKQMSDGTLRAFAIMLAMTQKTQPQLVVIEEPEVAIHLGALQSLVEILKSSSSTTQVLITTHSADIIDEVPVDSLRVVWSDQEQSQLATVSEHTRSVLRSGMITPGALLRADALDPDFAA